MSKTIEIGPYSAYAIAVKYGYVGTEEDWIKAVEAARKSAEASAANAKREAAGASTSAATATEQARIATTKLANPLHPLMLLHPVHLPLQLVKPMQRNTRKRPGLRQAPTNPEHRNALPTQRLPVTLWQVKLTPSFHMIFHSDYRVADGHRSCRVSALHRHYSRRYVHDCGICQHRPCKCRRSR